MTLRVNSVVTANEIQMPNSSDSASNFILHFQYFPIVVDLVNATKNSIECNLLINCECVFCRISYRVLSSVFNTVDNQKWRSQKDCRILSKRLELIFLVGVLFQPISIYHRISYNRRRKKYSQTWKINRFQSDLIFIFIDIFSKINIFYSFSFQMALRHFSKGKLST